jgi:hypothetical protein
VPREEAVEEESVVAGSSPSNVCREKLLLSQAPVPVQHSMRYKSSV